MVGMAHTQWFNSENYIHKGNKVFAADLLQLHTNASSMFVLCKFFCFFLNKGLTLQEL